MAERKIYFDRHFEDGIKQRPYPLQVASFGRMNAVLGIDANFDIAVDNPGERKAESYLAPTNLCFFRLVMNCKNAEGGKTFYANIPMDHIGRLFFNVKNIMRENTLFADLATTEDASIEAIETGAVNNAASAKSAAYTQQIMMGRYKGYVPADILIKDPSKKDDLAQTAEYLLQNASGKYEKMNRTQAAAIKEAISLLEQGKLNAADVSSSNQEFPAYIKSQGRIGTAHLKQEGSGLPLRYNIAISYFPANKKKSRWRIQIENYYAPEKQLGNGLSAVELSQRSDYKKGHMMVTDAEIFDALNHMNATYNSFLMDSFREKYRTAWLDSYTQYYQATNKNK